MPANRETIGRRAFIRAASAAAVGVSLPGRAAGRQFFTALVPGSIGVRVGQAEAIALAAKHGFASVQPFPADLEEDGAQRHADALGERGLRWAAAGLPVDFRGDEESFEGGLAALPRAAAALRAAGAERVGTWLRPSSDSLTYLQNFRRTARRLRRVAAVLEDHGLRLGLEYVGTKRNWTAARHSFVHTLAGTRELIGEIDMPNVGVVLDSWHWWTSGESGDDLRALSGTDVVSADLNDAPAGLAREDQYDNRRELPLATGVIDVADFLAALLDIGYDGPVRAEPFNQRLSDMGDDAACGLASAALDKAFAIVDRRDAGGDRGRA